MWRATKRFFPLIALAASARCVLAFSLLGPPPLTATSPDGYQQPVIGYFVGGDFGGPKNLGEEYRWNTPVVYYSFDANFLDYFGSNGVVEIEKAIAIINALTNVSAYSAALSEFPLEAMRFNFRAQALSLLDLKSAALSFLAEEFGLAEPERWTWALRDRRGIPNLPCPFMTYDVIKRNWDPVTWEPSSYVNGNLYSYFILEFCTGPNPLADAIEFPVDPLANNLSAVASYAASFQYGAFWTGLTRDDVGGLRYMWRTNNLNVETVETNSLVIATNLTSQLLVTSNLTLLAAQALTNTAAQLQALYPGLIVASTTNIFTNVVTTNLFAYFTNFPWAPAGSFASLAFVTNRVTNVVTLFSHTFANVVTNSYFTSGLVTVLTTNITQCGGFAQPGLLCTNITQTTLFTNIVVGDFYIIPANLCGFNILSTQLTSLSSSTNLIVLSTNAFGATNVGFQEFSESLITYFTQHVFIARGIVCTNDSPTLRQGMEKVTFFRRDYDSLLGQFYQPFTNTYRLYAITNNQLVLQTFQRVVTRPDFLFSAEERNAPDLAWRGIGFREVPRYVRFVPTPNPGAIDGPGILQPPITIEFNKVGPLFFNIGPFFVDEANAILNFIWGSFDGSTNTPVVYPNHRSIVDMENQVLMQMAPASLPDGSVGNSYTAQLSGNGGQPPYSWSRAPGSPGPPPGLTLLPTGTITGTPTDAGTFDFVVRMTDAGGRFIDRPYAITIQ